MRPTLLLSVSLVLAPLAVVTGQEIKSRPMPRGVVVQGNVERYPVTGTTIPEITAGFRSAVNAEGGFMGHYSVSWRYNYRVTNQSGKAGCRLQNVRVDMQTRVRVPDWQTSPEATPEATVAWSTFQTAFENHVREHENIAIRTAGDFVQKLERMSDLSCNQLQLDVQREARSSSERMQDRQRKFDEDTKHGATAGARWPPAPPPPPGS
jgi:predicted secreted Zn-dependent protease